MADENEALIKALHDAATEDRGWVTNAMAKLPVRLPAGGKSTYKTVALESGLELFYAGAYAGKKANVIFQFKPVDDRPFEIVEIAEDKIALVPGFERFAIEALGYAPVTDDASDGDDQEPFLTDASVGEPEWPTFAKARGMFKRDYAKREKARLEAEAASNAKSQQHRYADEPMWGMF